MKKKLLGWIIGCFILFNDSYAYEMNAEKFTSWWLDFRNTPTIPEELKKMEDYFVSKQLLNECSKFWLALNQLNITQIANYGYENFKQTVACNYFTWVVENDHLYSKNLFQHNLHFLDEIPRSEMEKKHAFFTQHQSVQYNRATAMLYHYLVQKGGGSYLENIEEPPLGNAPWIAIKGKSISQDVLNSLLEFLSIAAHHDLSKVNTVLEIGAGSGRTAYCFMQQLPQVKYIVVDIPPALYLSQTYLSEMFPNRKIFTFREFNGYGEIKEEYENADLVFLTPDQMEMIPSHSVDLFLAIDCLHEMKKETIQFFFNQVHRLALFFYFKCWKETVVPYDNISLPFHSYPIPNTWKIIFEEPCFVPSEFIHAFYNCFPN